MKTVNKQTEVSRDDALIVSNRVLSHTMFHKMKYIYTTNRDPSNIHASTWWAVNEAICDEKTENISS